MGNISSPIKSVMEENLKKQQEFMLQTQKLQLGRQVAMQHMMMKKQMALQMARQRDLYNWIAAFTGTYAIFSVIGVMKTKKPTPLAPLLPLGFITAYQYDMAHGNKMTRLRKDAEYILEETDRVDLPLGDLSIEKIDSYKRQ